MPNLSLNSLATQMSKKSIYYPLDYVISQKKVEEIFKTCENTLI